MDEQTAAELLRDVSLRVTRQRVSVLCAIHASPHADVGTIASIVRDKIGAVSTQAVYGVLNTLVDVQLARRIDLPNSGARYEGQNQDSHQHVVCRACGVIADVNDPLSSLARDIPQDHGFRIDEVEVTFWGECPDCQFEHAEPDPLLQ